MPISIEKKVEVFEEYFNEGNKVIHTSTNYKGYPLGNWQNRLRYLEEKGELPPNLTSEMKEKLIEFGVLNNRQRGKRTTDIEKIEIIDRFIKENPDLELTTTIVSKDGIPIGQYINDLRNKYNRVNSNNKPMMAPEIKKIMEERNFFYDQNNIEVERLKEKLGVRRIEAKNLKRKYGNLENIIKLYKEGKLDKEEEKMIKKLKAVRCIVINSDLDNNTIDDNYARLAKEIVELNENDEIEIKGKKYSKILMIDKVKMDKMLSKLNPREKFIISAHYGLTGEEKVTQTALGEKFGIRPSAVYQYIRSGIEKLGAYNRKEPIHPISNGEYVEEFKQFVEEMLLEKSKLANTVSIDVKAMSDDLGIDEKVINAFHMVDVRKMERKCEVLKLTQNDMESNLEKIYDYYWDEKYPMEIDEECEKIRFLMDISNNRNINVVKDSLDEDLIEKFNISSRVEANNVLLNSNKYNNLSEYDLVRLMEYSGLDLTSFISKVPSVKKGKVQEYITPMELSELKLSVRTFNSLKRNGYNTLDDISNLTFKQLSKIKGLGLASIDELIEKVRAYIPEFPKMGPNDSFSKEEKIEYFIKNAQELAEIEKESNRNKSGPSK